jgi:hypothetical protein
MNFKAHHSINPSVFGLFYGCLYSLSSWLWSYGSWIYNYLCNQCLSPLVLWVRISIRARCKTLSSGKKEDQGSYNELICKTSGLSCLRSSRILIVNINTHRRWSVLLVEETRGPGETHWPNPTTIRSQPYTTYLLLDIK